MSKKQAKFVYFLLGVLLIVFVSALAYFSQPPGYVPLGGPAVAPSPRPNILIEQEPADLNISDTIGETRTFSITTNQAATVTWKMMKIRAGPRKPPGEREEALSSPLLRPEPIPEPKVSDEEFVVLEIRQDVGVTFSEVKILAPEVGHFGVYAYAVALVDGEIIGEGSTAWDWEVEETP